MNVLPLVLSILFILTFGFYSCLEKEAAVYRINKTFLTQAKLSRQLLGAYEKENYNAIKAAKKIKSPDQKAAAKKREKKAKELAPPSPINPECARLNIWPLIYSEKKEHPVLYEKLAHLFRFHYQKPLFKFFSDKSGLEYLFLDAWLASLKKMAAGQSKEDPLILEKATFKDRSLQTLYYNMLRGSKEKYPPLLDFIKATLPLDKKEKVCLLHATPNMLAVFFGSAAEAVYKEMHSETLAVTEERIEELCRLHHGPQVPKELFELLSLSRFKHPPSAELTLWEEDEPTKTSMRKRVYQTNNQKVSR